MQIDLKSHIKYRFDNNESAWLFMYNYFNQFLQTLLVSYVAIGQTPCVVFDIDHTVLQYKTPIFTNSQSKLKELRLTSSIARHLYHLFLTHNVPIYFVTARPQTPINIQTTEKELSTLGFTNYKRIFYMPPTNTQDIQTYVGNYKQSVRQTLKPILFNVGDQWTDILNVPIDEKKYDETEAYVLYNAEPDCDWALKLIPFRDRNALCVPHTSSSNNSIFNSVFETISPFTRSDICQHCGQLH